MIPINSHLFQFLLGLFGLAEGVKGRYGDRGDGALAEMPWDDVSITARGAFFYGACTYDVHCEGGVKVGPKLSLSF